MDGARAYGVALDDDVVPCIGKVEEPLQRHISIHAYRRDEKKG
jgi:hypothetical protein